MLPATAGETPVLATTSSFVNVAPVPPTISVIAPPSDTTEELATVRLAPPVGATVAAAPVVDTPTKEPANGPLVMAEGDAIAVTGSNSTPIVGAVSGPMV